METGRLIQPRLRTIRSHTVGEALLRLKFKRYFAFKELPHGLSSWESEINILAGETQTSPLNL
jgi:hypothetical protein